MPASRIVIVEDEPHLADCYRQALTQAGFQAQTARTGREGLTLCRAQKPDLVILDLGLIGDLDGFDVLSALRSQGDTPVLILTAQAGEASLLRGLTLGADNFVSKPISAAALVARVSAHLRRRSFWKLPAAIGRYQYGRLILDLERGLATAGNRSVTFGERELRVLARLMRTPGEAVTYEELLAQGWHRTDVLVRSEDAKTLLTCIYRLRTKLRRLGAPEGLIERAPNAGFLIAVPDLIFQEN